MMAARTGYRWHLRRLMAGQDMYATTQLGPLLAERGITLSREQVYRLVLDGAQDSDDPGVVAALGMPMGVGG